MGYHIRWAKNADVPEILEIDACSSRLPLSEESLDKLLYCRQTICMVVEERGEILGFVVYLLAKRHLSIERISVKPTARRQRVGLAMIERLVSKLSLNRRRELLYRVCDHDLSRHLFLSKCGMGARMIRDGCECGGDSYRFKLEIQTYDPVIISTAANLI